MVGLCEGGNEPPGSLKAIFREMKRFANETRFTYCKFNVIRPLKSDRFANYVQAAARLCESTHSHIPPPRRTAARPSPTPRVKR
ncbi:hypothetical protein ANN_21084 [Periplaneta americana]|uniref:Uncharacterized protein n=1 Tax=Periplaneta americana TaxID=6978 RepID=A0ABQ8SFI6_PERAM|nr:hypothetical protein ANN_21084 [Periplaneta americana]